MTANCCKVWGGANVAALILWSVMAPTAAAQSSSLYGAAQQRQPLTLSECSWIFQKPDDPRTVKLHELITVVVNEKSTMTSNGQMDRKKQAHGDLALKKWIVLDGLRKAVPDPQTLGSPEIDGELDNKMLSSADLQTKDTLSFNIACTVVDIRPNGNIVLEGRRSIRNNEETWEYSLTGELRPDSLLPNNTVLSENIADLQIIKREKGHVRDGYRRGWMLEWLDKWQPF
ncbi:MAG: flagellar basal body L-ring protein FlgH [Thermoguttaceae bacterium]